MHHEVHILAAGRWGVEKKCGIYIHKIPLPLFFTKLGKFAIRKPLKHMNFDIVHCHMIGLWGRVIPKIIKHDRFIVTCHGEGIYPKKLKSNVVAEPVLKSADLVTCVSKWMVDYVKQEYGVKSIFIPNGVNERFKPLRIKRSKNLILYAGRLIKRKGIFELLESAKEMSEYNFYFAGEGDLKDKITLPNTKYIGFIENEEMINRFSKGIQPYLMLLIAKKLYNYTYSIFLDNLYNIRDKYKPIYYALLYFMRESKADEYRRMGTELQQTVEEIVDQIRQMQKDYA